jgi:hypothetical protein
MNDEGTAAALTTNLVEPTTASDVVEIPPALGASPISVQNIHPIGGGGADEVENIHPIGGGTTESA